MIPSTIFYSLLACLMASAGSASPIVCPDSVRDGILKGEISPEKCCSYGVCKGDVVISMQ